MSMLDRRRVLAGALALVAALAGGCRTAPPAGPAAPPATPTVIVLSMDGWRWDYDTKATLPAIRRLIAGGVRAKGLVPGFPTKTFPNHYSIVTGLYPGHHGVIGNAMVDAGIAGRFTVSNPAQVGNAAWWGGEPLWVTAIRQGRLASALFWPGSEAAIGGIRPTDWAPFDVTTSAEARVDRLLTWLDRPPDRRPALLLAYISDADEAGHDFGPDSPELIAALRRVDRAIARLLTGLETRGLAGRVNVVLVSDHGMATTSRDRVIALSDYLDPAAVDVIDINPHLAVAPKTMDADDIYRRLVHAHPHLRVYRKADTPPAWRFRDQPRVPPIVGVADEGWSLVRQPIPSDAHFGLGQHGYDPSVAAMHGWFVANGPAFRRGIVVPEFPNVDVYDVLARVLGIRPAPNDGNPATAAQLLR